MTPLQDFAGVNVPSQVNQEVAGTELPTQQRAHIFPRDPLVRELHAALDPRRQRCLAILEIQDRDVLGRRVEMSDQNGQGALRDRAVADKQNFIFE
jgi:hypothetical protein